MLESNQQKPTARQVRDALRYEPDTGLFWWRQSGSGRDLAKPAGTLCHGYIRIWFGKRSFQASILAWVIMKGYWPKREIDHRDTNRTNDRWTNLRLATHGQNQQNSAPYKNNKSGFKRVTFQHGKWRADIQYNRKQYYLGRFESPEEAHAAYVAAAKKYHREFARF